MDAQVNAKQATGVRGIEEGEGEALIAGRVWRVGRWGCGSPAMLKSLTSPRQINHPAGNLEAGGTRTVFVQVWRKFGGACALASDVRRARRLAPMSARGCGEWTGALRGRNEPVSRTEFPMIIARSDGHPSSLEVPTADLACFCR